MKKLLLTTAVMMAVGSTAAFAHHPAAEIVDPDIYEMIDENVSDIHADMTFDDMGGDTTDVGSARESIANDVGNAGMETGGDLEDVGAGYAGDIDRESIANDVGNAGMETGGDLEGVGAEHAGDIDVEAAQDSSEEFNSMADAEPSGPMSAQR